MDVFGELQLRDFGGAYDGVVNLKFTSPSWMRCRAYIFPIVINFPIDVSAHDKEFLV